MRQCAAAGDRIDRSRCRADGGGFPLQVAKHGRKRKLLIDGFVASPPEPLRVSEFQAHLCTRLVRGACTDVLGFGLSLAVQEEIAQKCQLERKHQLREV